MNIKRFCVATSISLLGFLGCGKNENTKQLEADNQMLLDFSIQQDEVINEVAASINQFEGNLKAVSQKEEQIWTSQKIDLHNQETQLAKLSKQLQSMDSLIYRNEGILSLIHISEPTRPY